MYNTQEETLKKYLGIRSDRDVLKCILERFELPYMDALYRDKAGVIWLKWENTTECFAGHMRRKLEEALARDIFLYNERYNSIRLFLEDVLKITFSFRNLLPVDSVSVRNLLAAEVGRTGFMVDMTEFCVPNLMPYIQQTAVKLLNERSYLNFTELETCGNMFFFKTENSARLSLSDDRQKLVLT